MSTSNRDFSNHLYTLLCQLKRQETLEETWLKFRRSSVVVRRTTLGLNNRDCWTNRNFVGTLLEVVLPLSRQMRHLNAFNTTHTVYERNFQFR